MKQVIQDSCDPGSDNDGDSDSEPNRESQSHHNTQRESSVSGIPTANGENTAFSSARVWRRSCSRRNHNINFDTLLLGIHHDLSNLPGLCFADVH